ncbi:MAG TPA: O-antigen ligase family protein [Thiolinea sp.]|nr:O-antigen ligase family protein [Thiolinea sp.]
MLRILAVLFVISIFIPVEFFVMAGTVRIETYRIVLALTLVYAFFNLRTVLKRADLTDVLLLGLIILSFASFWYNHSLQKAIESTGLYLLETLGAFYLAKLFITTPERFYRINQAFIGILVLLTLPAIYEALSHHRILHEWAERLTGHLSIDYRLYTDYYIRGSIMRTTSVFAHPILYGTLAALFFPFAILLFWRQQKLRQLVAVLGLVISMLTTLSSAPLLSLIFQAFTVPLVKFWHTARRFWVALFFSGLASAMLIQALSNRGFFGILISYLTFNPNTGYFRMLQWEYTMDDIQDHPILGIAHNDWTRPYWKDWMGDSIDSFWLLVTLQHGIFAFMLLFTACLYAVFSVLNQVHRQHESIKWMVSSWILSFMSLILIGFTVDYFDKLQPMFFFTLGAMSWAKYYLMPETPIANSGALSTWEQGNKTT